ncbi:ferritin-like domain-containing protein [Kitasatospora sp. NPDC006697]|uniref:ferritin-like domain-containing protein n=1 Tax=Kitasatospora sp. NPDC006697 TaxID=3364020 RepID=UPI00368DF8AC
MQSTSRRTFLAAGALATVGLLAACTSGSGGPGGAGSAPGHRSDPDLPLRSRAVADTDALLAQYAAAPAGQGGDLPGQLRAELTTERAALATGLPSSAAPGSAAGSPASGGPAPAGSAPAAGTPAALAAAEKTAALARLADLPAASGELARLLASVSAAGALRAVRLGDQTPLAAPAPTASPSASAAPAVSGSPGGGPALSAEATAALQAALAGEHAAVYAYGVIAARTPSGPHRDDVRSCYAFHQARRDSWDRLLAGAGATPAAAAPGYQLPFAVPDEASAARLAAEVERRLGAGYADLVAAGSGDLRMRAATALRETVLQCAHWGGSPGALPGLAAAAPSGSPSPSGSAH